MIAINWIVLYPNFLILGRTLAVNSVNLPTRPSVVAIPTNRHHNEVNTLITRLSQDLIPFTHIYPTMSLIDFDTLWFGRWRWFVFPLIFSTRVPEYSIIVWWDIQVLSYAMNPSREAIDARSIRLDHGNLDERIMEGSIVGNILVYTEYY